MLNYKISQIDSPTTLNTKDIAILEGVNVNGKFTPYEDRVKVIVADIYGKVYSIDNNFTLFTLENDYTTLNNTEYSQIKVDFDRVLAYFNLFEGEYIIYFSFNKPLFLTTPENTLFISEISSDRTELRLDGTLLDNTEVLNLIRLYQGVIEDSSEIKSFYLEFNTGDFISGVNLLLTEQNQLLVKLYQPLPLSIELKSTCFIYEEVGQQVTYRILFDVQNTLTVENTPYLRGPNFNLDIKNENPSGFGYQNLNNLLLTYSSSSLSQIKSVLEEKDIEINVDYTNFDNFIHYSSAKQRLLNFYHKVSLIESYQNDLNTLLTVTGSTSASLSVSQSKQSLISSIDSYIDKFDGFEYYMYFESGSFTWPKTNLEPPYTLYSTGSNQAQAWINNRIASGSIYDDENKDNLVYTIPRYILEDTNNTNYILFVNMIGQLFDINWLYTKGITDKLNTDNRSEFGAPKKLMRDILNSVGLPTYENQFLNQDLFTSLIGVTPDGQLNYPTGSEKISTFITASKAFTLEDYQAEVYKRMYHNLPYLLKKKGTIQGLRTLIDLFGIPDTILRINEYGGKDKNNTNDWDYWYNQYNYAYTQNGDNYIDTEWGLNSDWGAIGDVPATVMFKFRTNGLPTSNIPRSQSLWKLNDSASPSSTIILTYTGSGYITSSLISSSAGPIDPYYQYAKLDFIPDSSSLSTSASVYLPFFDGGWWSVMLTSGSNFTLYAKNSIYNGYDGSRLGFQASSSVAGNISLWQTFGTSFFGESSSADYNKFSGSFQEIRYYTVPISESVFDDYVMNPNSIEGNGTNQGPNQLAFRASLGGELYTGSTSIHPKVTGSWVTTSSFAGNSSFFYSTAPTFVSNTQSIFFDQPPVGIKNPVADKIKQQGLSLPYSSSLANIPGNTILSRFRSVQQDYAISQSYTKDINYIEVAFSPQNEINDDINSQIGYINIGEYIGDPRLVSSSAESYPTLNTLRDAYFEKYTKNYNYNDYIRLIKYFDNSLFRMIKDFTPARASLSSGVVIKQHLLERNKYPVPQITPNTPIAYQGSGSNNITWNTPFIFQNILVTGSGIQMYTITGSNGGSFPNLQGQTSSVILPSNYNFSITQSWSGTTPSVSGSVPFTQSSQIEFFNGELSGSALVVTDGDLNGGNPFLNVDPTEIRFSINTFESTTTPLLTFTDHTPANGFIRTWYDYTPTGKPPFLFIPGLQYMQIPLVSGNGINVFSTLKNLEEITFQISGVKYSFIIQSRVYNSAPYPGYIGPYRPHFLYRILYRPSNTNFGATAASYPNTLTSLSPYVPIPFVNSDYDSLINNATQDRRSIKYMDVDYVDSQLSPINLQGLLSGSATPAPVQDSNYTLGKQINSRYIGKNLESEKFNQWTPGDVAYGKTPNVSNPRTYFVQFNWLAGTSPEWGNNIADKTQASIRYIIDENGNRTIPINDPEGINQSIIEQSFAGGNAISQLVNSDAFGVNMGILNGTFSVFKAGKRIVPILYTQTASYYTDPATGQRQVVGFGYTGSINFQNGLNANPANLISTRNNYQLTTFAPQNNTSFSQSLVVYNQGNIISTPPTPANPLVLKWASPISIGASASFATASIAPITGSIYKPTGSLGNLSDGGYTLTFNFRFKFLTSMDTGMYLRFQIEKSTDNITWNRVSSRQLSIGASRFPGDFTPTSTFNDPLTYTDFNATTASLYRASLWGTVGLGSTPPTGEIILDEESTFTVNQYPPVGPGIVSRFWLTGSNSNFLYAKESIMSGPSVIVEGLNNYYGERQTDIPNSGFDNILYDFEPQLYDEIRFEGTELYNFTILNVTQSITSSGNIPYNALTLVLDKPIPPAINTDYFALRRYIDDPSNIILNIDKPAGGTSGGTLKPEFITTQTERVVKETITNIVDQ